MPYPPELDRESGGAGGLLYPPELDPELDGAGGLLYPPDDGLLYKPEDDGREDGDDDGREEGDDDGREEGDDEDLDGDDEAPFAATTSVTETNASSARKATPTPNNCFFICRREFALGPGSS